MKKDYLPEVKKQKEIDFVEDFWTTRWNKAKLPVVFNQIAKREEFRLMKPYLDKLASGSRILDGGCGLGEWVLYLHSLGFKVTGIDISKKTVSRLKRRFPKNRFIVGDIRNTHLPKNSFDAYFSWGTFEHFEEGLSRCFQEAQRILKPKGLLFISVPFDNIRLILRDWWEWEETNYSKRRFYQWRLTKTELKQQLTLHGFKPLEITPIHKAHGLRLMLKHELKVTPESFWHKPLQLLFYPLMPKNFTSHMLMAVARKK